MTVAGRNRSLERLLKMTRGALLIHDCAIGFALTLSAKLRVDAISIESRFPGGTGGSPGQDSVPSDWSGLCTSTERYCRLHEGLSGSSRSRVNP